MTETKTTQTLTCEVPVSDAFLACCVVTAVEGGVGYWATIREYDGSGLWPNGSDEVNVETVYAVVTEDADENPDFEQSRNLLNTEAVLRGLRRIISDTIASEDENPPTNNATRSAILGAIMRDDAGEIDSDLADIIAQVALLGEVRYG